MTGIVSSGIGKSGLSITSGYGKDSVTSVITMLPVSGDIVGGTPFQIYSDIKNNLSYKTFFTGPVEFLWSLNTTGSGVTALSNGLRLSSGPTSGLAKATTNYTFAYIDADILISTSAISNGISIPIGISLNIDTNNYLDFNIRNNNGTYTSYLNVYSNSILTNSDSVSLSNIPRSIRIVRVLGVVYIYMNYKLVMSYTGWTAANTSLSVYNSTYSSSQATSSIIVSKFIPNVVVLFNNSIAQQTFTTTGGIITGTTPTYVRPEYVDVYIGTINSLIKLDNQFLYTNVKRLTLSDYNSNALIIHIDPTIRD